MTSEAQLGGGLEEEEEDDEMQETSQWWDEFSEQVHFGNSDAG